MPTTLERILATTAATLPPLRARRSEIEAKALGTPSPPAFLGRWDRKRVALIAEVKRRSPSAGDISTDLDPTIHAARYARSGAAAVSVLTDGPYFGGSLEDLQAVSVTAGIPTLRKDFILDEVQIAEARAAGASAVLLIVRALTPVRLRELLGHTRALGLEALVEAHDRRELDTALQAGVGIVGINSRNLDDFRIDIDAAWELMAGIPKDVVAIAESGMATRADVARAAQAGADGVLIGTALSSSPDPSALVQEVTLVGRRGR
ncbi:MAG TPA: indole-3-glycerol phosphate synthase TrpC [Gemmatimonadales bacterium]|nr:indole-3-glycerol phosphate synthase TrpC [Gemmatimonadales bacterium]